MANPAAGRRLWGRSAGDFLLFGITAVELGILIFLTPSFAPADWIYVCSNLLVLGLALTRRPAQEQDRSIAASIAVLVSYTYSYAQVVLLHWFPGNEAWPAGGLVLVLIGASLSLASLICLGRFFGVRPPWRGVGTPGPYHIVRHPLYLAYVLQDIGYNLHEWSVGTLLLVAAGWASMIYRIHAEERVLSHDANWADYARRVPYRLLPGVY